MNCGCRAEALGDDVQCEAAKLQPAMRLTNVVPMARLDGRCEGCLRSRCAATLLHETSRAITCRPSWRVETCWYARVRGGRRGGDPSMACKGSGVQIPSAPPQVKGPLRRRPPPNRPPRAANRQQSACARPIWSSGTSLTRPTSSVSSTGRPGPTGAAATSPVVRDEGRIGRAR
jgi:hypothetical protein